MTKEEAFGKLADMQRGEPEAAMLKAQRELTRMSEKYPSGAAWGWALEHVGDIIHRMSEQPYASESNHWGKEYIEPKIRVGLRVLTNPVDLKNLKNIPVPDSAKAYAHAHSKLPTYNKAQKAAKNAAVNLGMGNFAAATSALYELKDMMDDGTWDKIAGSYHVTESQFPLIESFLES